MNNVLLRIVYYIKKFLGIIILFCILALFLLYSFLNSKQNYTATVDIEYTNKEAVNGYAPDGTEIDPTEILSSKNIANVIDDLDLSVSVDYIRNRITITEIIPEEETEKKEAALKNGDAYEYKPTQYEISFSVDSSKSKEFASDILNSLLSEYYISYSEAHINKETIPANTKTLLDKNYDYLETVEVMQDSISTIVDYLSTQQTNFPDYRSSKTGYSYTDLYNSYMNIKEEDISSLFSYVLQNKITKDYDVLIRKYNKRINDNELEKLNKETELNELKSLTDSYAVKSKEQIQYQTKSDDEENGIILKDVDNTKAVDKTTYDNLILQYVDTLEKKRQLDVDINYSKNILNIFGNGTDINKTNTKTIDSNIEIEIEKLSNIYKILAISTDELNEVLGAKNIKTISNIVIKNSFNIKMYMTLGVIVFLFIGCFGTIVIGRMYDIIFDILYKDNKTGLYNHTKCDLIINDYSKKILDENMFLSAIIIENLKEINTKYGRTCGDLLLKHLGNYILNIFPSNADLTYNGTGQFLLFIPNSSTFTLNSYIDKLLNKIHQFEKEKMQENSIKIRIVSSNSAEENTYDIRDLITETFKKLYEAENND